MAGIDLSLPEPFQTCLNGHDKMGGPIRYLEVLLTPLLSRYVSLHNVEY